MPLQATSGAASYDAFGGGVAAVPNYIEDVFSTWLYTGNGSTQTINNGIDLAGKGGLVWIKGRNLESGQTWSNTANGATRYLQSSSNGNQITDANSVTSFNSNGFSIGNNGNFNSNTFNFASWTFREQAKFFDIVTYTGNSVAGRQISHNLGGVPGCIIIKSTSNVGTNWAVYHRSIPNTDVLLLNSTNAQSTNNRYWNNTTPTSTVFTVGDSGDVNNNGWTYTAYLFAHNAGGFGLTGTDNVISCGSFTTDGSGNATVNLGYEPQWLTFKSSTGVQNWLTIDTMRGWINNTSGFDAHLIPNASNAETSSVDWGEPTATGFNSRNLQASATYIYIAIRRGPMKTPTSGTSVYTSIVSSAGTGTKLATNFAIDLQLANIRGGNPTNSMAMDRLRGVSSTTTETSGNYLVTSATDAENTVNTNRTRYWDNTGFQMPSGLQVADVVFWNFRRAPGFFDEVCYTGNGTAGAAWNHNLGVAPELIIVKQRSTSSGTRNWISYSATTGINQYLYLNTTDAASSLSGVWHTAPTASVFYTNNFAEQNTSGSTYVAYLFASCPGVSKVFNYTGNGSSQTINCGFTGGARFVMIKRTDSTRDWYVWDTARGIVANNDPHLSLNSTAAEVTTNDTIDTDSTGFVVNQVAATNVNVNGASYIGLAIA